MGDVTSGGFGPSVDAPVAMGYVPTALAKPGTRIFAEVRGKRLPVSRRRPSLHPATATNAVEPLHDQEDTLAEIHRRARMAEARRRRRDRRHHRACRRHSSATSSSSSCPRSARSLRKGDGAATVESVKAASDVFAPLDGEIVEVNQAIVDDPALVNSDPQGDGWFFKLKLADATADVDGLMDEAAYKQARSPDGVSHGRSEEIRALRLRQSPPHRALARGDGGDAEGRRRVRASMR